MCCNYDIPITWSTDTFLNNVAKGVKRKHSMCHDFLAKISFWVSPCLYIQQVRSKVIHVPQRSWPICTSRSIRAPRNSPITLIFTFSHWFIIPSPHHNFIDQLFCPIFAPASETHPIVLNVIYNTICFEGAVDNSMVTSIVLYAIRWLVLIEDGWMWFGWIFVFLWDWDEAAVGHWALSEKITKKNSNSELLRFFKWTFPLLLWSITVDAHVNKEFKSTFLVVYRLNVCPTPHTFKKRACKIYLTVCVPTLTYWYLIIRSIQIWHKTFTVGETYNTEYLQVLHVYTEQNYWFQRIVQVELGHFKRMEPLSTSLVTPVLFLLWQKKCQAVSLLC